MKRLKNIELVAEGGGRYNVIRDGQFISQHNTWRKAVESGVVQLVNNPESEVWFEQSLKINITGTFETIEPTNDEEETSDPDGDDTGDNDDDTESGETEDEDTDPNEEDEEPSGPVYYGVFKTE